MHFTPNRKRISPARLHCPGVVADAIEIVSACRQHRVLLRAARRVDRSRSGRSRWSATASISTRALRPVAGLLTCATAITVDGDDCVSMHCAAQRVCHSMPCSMPSRRASTDGPAASIIGHGQRLPLLPITLATSSPMRPPGVQQITADSWRNQFITQCRSHCARRSGKRGNAGGSNSGARR